MRRPFCRRTTSSPRAPGWTTASIPSRRASRSRRWERNQSPRRTLSRDDGAFDLVVNGGGPLVLVLERDGFLPVQRLVAPGWSEYGVVGDDYERSEEHTSELQSQSKLVCRLLL